MNHTFLCSLSPIWIHQAPGNSGGPSMANRFKVVNNSAVPPRPEVRRKTRNPVTVKSHTTGPWSLQQKNTLHITFISLSLYPYIVSLRKWSPSYPQLLGKKKRNTGIHWWEIAGEKLHHTFPEWYYHSDFTKNLEHFEADCGSPKHTSWWWIDQQWPQHQRLDIRSGTSWTSTLNNCATKEFAAVSFEWETHST